MLGRVGVSSTGHDELASLLLDCSTTVLVGGRAAPGDDAGLEVGHLDVGEVVTVDEVGMSLPCRPMDNIPGQRWLCGSWMCAWLR